MDSSHETSKHRLIPIAAGAIMLVLAVALAVIPPVPQKREQVRPADSAVLEPPLTETVLLDELTIADPLVADTLHRLDSAARSHAGDDGGSLNYVSMKAPQGWGLIWQNPPATSSNPYQNAAGGWGANNAPQQSFVVIARTKLRKRAVWGVDLYASAKTDNGWNTSLAYRRWEPQEASILQSDFLIRFHHAQLHVTNPQRSSGQTVIAFPLRYETRAQCRDANGLGWDYHVTINSSRITRASDTGSSLPDTILQSLLESPDSLQTAALAELDRLEALLREQIASGEAFVAAYDMTWRRTGADPPMPEPVSADSNTPTAAQRQQMLDAGLASIAWQRSIVRQHSADMFTSLQQAFPLSTCLTVRPDPP